MRLTFLFATRSKVACFNTEPNCELFRGEFYVQRRTMIKDYCPGYLDTTSGGVVHFGETYEENAEREVAEEMGIYDVPLKYLTTFLYKVNISRGKHELISKG